MKLGSITLEVDRYESLYAEDFSTIGRLRALLVGTPRPLSREQYEPGHITTSACVLSPAGDRVLLVHHVKLGMWVQPGGHVDDEDESLIAAAEREAIEECGISSVSRVRPDEPVDIDIHSIPELPGEPAHLHYDIRYAFRAPVSSLPEKNDESHAVEWVPVDGLSAYSDEESLHRLVQKVVARTR